MDISSRGLEPAHHPPGVDSLTVADHWSALESQREVKQGGDGAAGNPCYACRDAAFLSSVTTGALATQL